MTSNVTVKQPIRISFLAADPSDKSRTYLNKELQCIRERLKDNPNFELKDHLSVQAHDVIEEITSFKPNIVHIAGHGEENGEVCFEDELGKSQSTPPEALASLFKEASDYVKCVIVNTCFSELQAKAIAQHIPVVIGTTMEISDTAAIKFSTGFYTSLDPDLSPNNFKKAFNRGTLSIKFVGNQAEHLTPILIEGSPEVRFSSEVEAAFSMIGVTKGAAAKTLTKGLTLSGTNMGLAEDVVYNIIQQKITDLERYNAHMQEYEDCFRELLRDEHPLSETSVLALQHLQDGLNLRSSDAEELQNKILSDLKLDDAYSWYDRGVAQNNAKNHEQAIKYLTKAIEKNNQYAGAYYERGKSYFDLDQLQSAVEDFSLCIDINKNWEITSSLYLAHFSRGLAYYNILPRVEENVTLAREDWDKAVELDPGSSTAFYNRALANEFLRQFDEAIKDYEIVLEMEQDQPDINKAKTVRQIIKCYTEMTNEEQVKKWTTFLVKLIGKKEDVEVNQNEGVH